MKNLPQKAANLNRRDFLKLKFFTLLVIFFQQTFGVNLLANDNKVDYKILDELLKLPFSDVTKQELKLRVCLQKKYCYSSNGKLQPLKRFFNEIGHFIISNNNLMDFRLLNSVDDIQIDRIYYLNKAAQNNDVDIFKDLQSKLLTNNALLDEALLYAVKSRSIDTTIHLMQQKISLSAKTQETMMALFYKEEYDHFYKQLSTTSGRLLLPSTKRYDNFKNKRKMQKRALRYTGENYIDEFEENLFNVVYNAAIDLFIKEIIDDFSINKYMMKVDIKVWNHEQNYPMNFFNIFENTLKFNGYDELNRYGELLQLDSYELDSQKKLMRQDRIIDLSNGDICFNKVDDYDFIRIELL